MTPEQKAAYVNAQAACAIAEIEGMKAENTLRKQNNDGTVGFTRSDFLAIIDKYSLSHNSVLTLFYGD